MANWRNRYEKQVQANNHLHERLREVQAERDAAWAMIDAMQQEKKDANT